MNDYAMGLGVGLAVGLTLYAILYLVKRRTGGARQYDERQLAAQGKAAKAAMFTHMGYASVCICCCAGWDPAWLTLPVALFFGIVVSVGVYAVYCILHDAYFDISRSPRPTILLLAVVAAVEWYLALSAAARGLLVVDGALDMTAGMQLGCGVLMTAVVVTALLRLALNKRREARDEES